MKLLLLSFLLSVTGFAQSLSDSVSARPDWSEDIVPSFSLDYHYQRFHGMEAAMHLTHYHYGISVHHEYGIFFGTDLNFNNGFNVFAPTFGPETNFLFAKARGLGVSAKLHGTLYYRDRNAYFVIAPEIALSFMSIADIFYSYNYSVRTFDDWQPHRFGIRITLGYERTIFNVFDMVYRN
jgi:hypothetical protein